MSCGNCEHCAACGDSLLDRAEASEKQADAYRDALIVLRRGLHADKFLTFTEVLDAIDLYVGEIEQ